jgi:hypothetical protein
MRERESYYFILYIDDKPDALNMMANALISVKNKNVMTLVPEFPYNRTIGENLKRLGFKVHLMEHFFSCRYTKQSISATIKALRKFIERITYETGRG